MTRLLWIFVLSASVVWHHGAYRARWLKMVAPAAGRAGGFQAAAR